jgi:ArsR family transcriptional regulator, arsenate/arsenite/antimonite-responsive transcriptional repressor
MSEHDRGLALTNSTCCPPVTAGALTVDDAAAAATIFAALADPVRLRLFSLVASTDEVCSCTLEDPLQRSQPTISHHTRILADAGLIVGEKRGRWMWWRADPVRLAQVADILSP